MTFSVNHFDPVLTVLNGVSFVIDKQRTWAHLSSAWQTLTGFSVADTLGRRIDDFLLFGDYPAIQEIIGELLEGQCQQAVHEARCVTAAEGIRYVELCMTAHALEHSKEMAIVGIMRDVSERKRAEAAVIRSEQHIQRVVDHMPCMVACLSPDLRVTFANKAYAAHVDKRVDEVVGASLFDLLHPSQHAQARDHLASLSKDTPEYVFEHWVTRPNGVERYQRWTDHVFFDEYGRISEYQTVGVDLTAHKHVQDELQHSENKLRALIEGVSDIILTIDLEGTLTYLSPSWQRVIGYPVEEFLGMSPITLIHPADVSIVIESFDKVFAGVRNTESVFYRVEHADGEWHWHAGRGAPIVDDEGSITGAIIISRDVTNIREHQLLLKSSLDQLEQALADKTMLMKEIHHRTKNNLQIVASLLNLQSHKLSDKDAKDALAASRDRVIAIAKIHTMMYQGDSSDTVVFDAYLATLLDRFKLVYGSSGIRFIIYSSRFILPIDQAVPLGLIVNELITNAVKHAFPSSQEAPRVTISLESSQDNITVVVEDNGVGMSADVDPMTSDSLGMTIVQSLATQLGGSVTFANRDDVGGTQVAVWIPKQAI